MTSREIIFGIVGMAIGCITGVFATKKYYEKKCFDIINEEIGKKDQAEYTELAKEYSAKDEKRPVDDVSYKKGFDKDKDKKKEDVAYDAMYKAKKLAEEAAEEVDNEDESFEEYDRKKTKNYPPEIISEEAMGEVPSYYDHIDLFYYTKDDILTDDCDNVLEDRERFLGTDINDILDSLTDQNLIIRNYELSTVYEIQKFESSFEEG